MSMVKKFLTVISAALIIGTVVNTAVIPVSAAFTPNTTVYSEGVYMVNLDTDIPVVAINEHKQFYPASTTKIMTALITVERVKDLNQKVKVTYDAFNEFNTNYNNTGVSHADIRPLQDNLTYLDCLYALMLPSACEAANILAYNIGGGDIQAFVDMMNVKAKELGAYNTHFSNPHGLHDKSNYTTPYDLYLISRYVYDTYPLIMEIADTYQYEMPPNSNNPTSYIITNTNSLIKNTGDNPYYNESVSGLKTGSIDKLYDVDTGEFSPGCRSLVSTASKDGFTYMLVTLGAPYTDSEGTRIQSTFLDHNALYKWAFSTFEHRAIILKEEPMTQVPVRFGNNADVVQLLPLEDYYSLLPKDLDNLAIRRDMYLYTYDTEGNEVRVPVTNINANTLKIDAPVLKGEILGEVELYLSGEKLATVALIAARNVSRSDLDYTVYKLQQATKQGWFMPLVIWIIILFILLIALLAFRSNVRKKAKRRSQRINRTGRR